MFGRFPRLLREAIRTLRGYLPALSVFCAALALALWTWPAVIGWFRAHLVSESGRAVLGWFENWGPVGVAIAAFAVADLARRWWSQRRQLARGKAFGRNRPDNLVDRPAELNKLVALLRHRDRAAPVGVTTGLQGAGGFGKTTLAHMVASDRRILRRFGGRVAWITLGRDQRGFAVLGKLHEAMRQVALSLEADAAIGRSTVVELAGRELGLLLDGQPPWLLILDDVWEIDQLEPFLIGGGSCARLVTTRDQNLLRGGRGDTVVVDQMTPDQARRVLLFGLPAMAPDTVERLLDVTGRWPLLLALVNRIIVNQSDAGADATAAGEELYQRLRLGGPGVVDPLTRVDRSTVDINDPRSRALAVEATLRASTEFLSKSEAERLDELTTLAEDETCPISVIAGSWQRSGGLDEFDTRQLCGRLAGLGLIRLDPADGGKISMHDVIRDYLRSRISPQDAARMQLVFLQAAASRLRPPGQADASGVANA